MDKLIYMFIFSFMFCLCFILFFLTESLRRVVDKCHNNDETVAFLTSNKHVLVFPQFQIVRLFAWSPDMDLWLKCRQDKNLTESLLNCERSLPLKSSGKTSPWSLKSHLTAVLEFLFALVCLPFWINPVFKSFFIFGKLSQHHFPGKALECYLIEQPSLTHRSSPSKRIPVVLFCFINLSHFPPKSFSLVKKIIWKLSLPKLFCFFKQVEG